MKVLNFEVPLSEIENGKNQLIDNNKILLYDSNPEWFELLDFSNDKAFSEPQLFYYFRSMILKEKYAVTLEQVFYGYLQFQVRPMQVKVMTDTNGIVYLPNYGYLDTGILGIRETLISQSSANENNS